MGTPFRRVPGRNSGPLREINGPAGSNDFVEVTGRSAYRTPVSPEEQVIKSRQNVPRPSEPGSLEDLGKEVAHMLLETPPKTPAETEIRKRLNLHLDDEFSPQGCSSPVPTVFSQCSTQPKRFRLQRTQETIDLQLQLKGLSNTQLVDLIGSLVNHHPELEKEVRDSLPSPDIKSLEERLINLRHNIFRSFPRSKFGNSRRDSYSYKHVYHHLEAFKKECLDQGRNLVTSQSWAAVLEYVFMAWGYVAQLPIWEDAPHNRSKSICFKGLAVQCRTALQRSRFEKEQYRDIREQLVWAAEKVRKLSHVLNSWTPSWKSFNSICSYSLS